MGFYNGAGFILAGGNGGGGQPSTLTFFDISQFVVQAAGGEADAPKDGQTSWSPSHALKGGNITVEVTGFGALNKGVDYTFATGGTALAPTITSITLLGGRLFNLNELYTIFQYMLNP